MKSFRTSTRQFILGITLVSLWLGGCFSAFKTQKNSPELMQIHFINVGYGDAILIELPDNSAMLIDSGSKESSKNLIDYLTSRNIKSIQTVILTHPHENHFGGLSNITKSIPISRVFINGDIHADQGYSELLSLLSANKISVRRLKRDSKIDKLPTDIEAIVLNPPNLKGNVNDNSLVVWLRYRETSFLFTADINDAIQNEIIRRYKMIQKSNGVQIPHHGGPINNQFINAFKNAIYVISTGPNDWGIPDEERLTKISREIFRTDRHGAVVFESDGVSMKVINKR